MQTNSIFERRRTFTPFVLMCWAEWAASVALAILSYLFLSGHVEASFWTFFFLSKGFTDYTPTLSKEIWLIMTS